MYCLWLTSWHWSWERTAASQGACGLEAMMGIGVYINFGDHLRFDAKRVIICLQIILYTFRHRCIHNYIFQRQLHANCTAIDMVVAHEGDPVLTRLIEGDHIPWYKKKNLRKLYLLLFPTCMGIEITSGFDSQLINSLQGVASWKHCKLRSALFFRLQLFHLFCCCLEKRV